MSNDQCPITDSGRTARTNTFVFRSSVSDAWGLRSRSRMAVSRSMSRTIFCRKRVRPVYSNSRERVEAFFGRIRNTMSKSLPCDL